MSADEVIDAHRCRERGMVCDEGELWCDTCRAIVNESDVSAHQVSQLKAAGYAVVELPKSDGLDDDGQEYFGNDLSIRVDHTGRRPDHPRLYINGRPTEPGVAREDASELLAAADAAEAQS